MPGLFDGMSISRSGINASRIQQEVIGQNIANASNDQYTRQEVRLSTGQSVFDGQHFLGQGVDVTKVTRIRDELLDTQLRHSASLEAKYQVQVDWLNKIEAAYDEPSEHGIGAALSNFWEGWAELANAPESFAARSSIITHTDNLSTVVNNLDQRLQNFEDEVDQELLRESTEINEITTEIAKLNGEIFKLEAGREADANTLRDRRDAALDRLSEKLDITYYEDANGMVNVMAGGHPAIINDRAEKLLTRNDTLDSSKLQLYWEYGETFEGTTNGSLAGVLNVRDDIVPGFRGELDSFISNVISETNKIYSTGVGMEPSTMIESRLGYEALGVTTSTTALSELTSGTYGSMHINFYDSSDNIVRSAGIVVESDDSLNDIALKLDGIKGVNAALISDTDNDGRLRITLDTTSGDNVMDEAGFAISNNTDGFDTSGFLSLVGFSQTDKTTNASTAQPTMSSVDLSTLQTTLGVSSVAAVRSTALNLAGTFTINAFETGTETGSKTNGNHVQQLAINVVSTDTIDSIIAKINTLTATHGVSATFNATTDKIDITSTAQTDSDGNLLLTGGTDYLRLSFSNTYRYPSAVNDEPPAHHNGKGDTTDILAKLQFNTLLQGDDAGSMALDSKIVSAEAIHAGFNLAQGDNSLALAMSNLQHSKVSGGNQFTLNEEYENHVASVGTEVKEMNDLQANESLLLEAFKTEKDKISGVSLDEELASMIEMQRSYEANARMFSTFNQMITELLSMVLR